MHCHPFAFFTILPDFFRFLLDFLSLCEISHGSLWQSGCHADLNATNFGLVNPLIVQWRCYLRKGCVSLLFNMETSRVFLCLDLLTDGLGLIFLWNVWISDSFNQRQLLVYNLFICGFSVILKILLSFLLECVENLALVNLWLLYVYVTVL